MRRSIEQVNCVLVKVDAFLKTLSDFLREISWVTQSELGELLPLRVIHVAQVI